MTAAGEPLLVGVDGGASKLNARIVIPGDDGFTLGAVQSRKTYHDYPAFQTDFIPVAAEHQLAQARAAAIEPDASEVRQARVYVQAATDAILDCARPFPGRPLLVGIGLPGIKTTDRRGIAIFLNGPRMPDFAADLEAGLSAAGRQLAAPIDRIGSDADYCGSGEEYAPEGTFRNVRNAYYLGGGSGGADALKLRGRLVPFDDTRTWLAKTWEFADNRGRSLESYVSAAGIRALYAEYSGTPLPVLDNQNVFAPTILERAATGEAAARRTFRTVSRHLAELLYERLGTLFSGWSAPAGIAFRDPRRPPLMANHSYLGTLLDRIVLGQRLGQLLLTGPPAGYFRGLLLADLTHLIAAGSEPDEFKKHYLCDGRYDPDRLVASGLTDAPVLGAGVAAWLHYREIH